MSRTTNDTQTLLPPVEIMTLARRAASRHRLPDASMDADDLAQVAAMAIVRANPASPALASTIAQRAIVDELRGRFGTTERPRVESINKPIGRRGDAEAVTRGDTLADPGDAPEAAVDRADQITWACSHAGLTARQRAALRCRLDGMTNDEAADFLGCGRRTFEAALAGAIAFLREIQDKEKPGGATPGRVGGRGSRQLQEVSL